MQELYATTMQLVHFGGGDPFEVAAQRALAWGCQRTNSAPPDLKESSNGMSGDLRGASISWTTTQSKKTRAVEIRLVHPDGKDAASHWKVSITITDVEGSTRVTLRVSFGAKVHTLLPSHISLRAPTLAIDLMEPPLLAYAGSMELSSHSKVVKAGSVTALIADQLEAEGRALPILVAAAEVNASLVDTLAKKLAGLVQVVHAADRESDLAFREVLRGSGYTVPRGGLRLFWPGFGTSNKSHRHPYWTAAQLRDGGRGRGPSVLDQLSKLLGPISTARVPADPGLLRVRQEALAERAEAQRQRDEAHRARARRQREAAKQAKEEALSLASDERVNYLEERLAEVEALLDQAERERNEADQRAEKAEKEEFAALEEALEHSERVERLQTENEALHRNLLTMQRFDGLSENKGESDSVPESLNTWEEIAQHLEDLEGPGFCLTPQAKGCADGKNRYPHPDVIWESLRALERVGRAYNEMGAELGMRFEQFAVEQAGLDVALQDNTYEGHYFEYEGEAHSRLPHVKVDDAKAPNEVGRIYFAIDSDGKRVIVDWFGTKPDRPQSKAGLSAMA
jgi:hypothetical protein